MHIDNRIQQIYSNTKTVGLVSCWSARLVTTLLLPLKPGRVDIPQVEPKSKAKQKTEGGRNEEKIKHKFKNSKT